MEKNKSGDWCKTCWGLGYIAILYASHLKEGREGAKGRSLTWFLAATVVTVVISIMTHIGFLWSSNSDSTTSDQVPLVGYPSDCTLTEQQISCLELCVSCKDHGYISILFGKLLIRAFSLPSLPDWGNYWMAELEDNLEQNHPVLNSVITHHTSWYLLFSLG